MTRTIEIYYSFADPYSYLAIDMLCELEKKFDVKALWQPYSARAVGKNPQGGYPIYPEKASYFREDCLRLAEEMNRELVISPEWPEGECDADKSFRGAIVAGDLDICLEYNIKMFNKWWVEGGDPNDQEFFIELCDDLDLDPNEFAGRISTTDTRERVKGIQKRAKKLQIFETPTVVIGEERFVGIDRIVAAEKKLKALGY